MAISSALTFPVRTHAETIQELEKEIQSLTLRIKALEAAARRHPVASTRPSRVAPVKPDLAQRDPGAAHRAPANSAPSPSPAPAPVAVDLVAAQHALDQTLVATGFALLPYGQVQIEPAFTYARNEASSPLFVNSAGTLTVANAQLRQNNYIGDVAIRAGLPWSSQIEVDVPYRYLDQRTNVSAGLVGQSIINASRTEGIADVTATLSKTMLTEGVWRPNLIAAIQYSSNTGRVIDGVKLGNGYPLVRGILTAVKSVDPLALVAGIGFGHGFESNGFNPGNEFDVRLGAYLSASPETTLRFELDQRFLENGSTSRGTSVGTGLTQATFVTGMSVIVAPHLLLDISTGIGLTSDTPKYFVRVSLPITFSWH